MKKTLLLLTLVTLVTLFTLSSNLAYSEEAEPELLEASEDYVISLLRLCQNYAIEDEISKAAVNAYLLTCINDELMSRYYKRITILPKED